MNFQTKLNDWLVPVVLGTMVYYMQSMAKDFHDMSVNIAIALERIDEIGRRTKDLEAWRRSNEVSRAVEEGRDNDGHHGGLRASAGRP